MRDMRDHALSKNSIPKIMTAGQWDGQKML